MIQEKDFLYRVPVKTAPITTPGGQIRNPEILVDVEGGEFMHGNILDANSTNKLINQSVKDAVDNKLIEGGYVTKDLLEAETTRATEQENSLKTLIGAETSARTKGDEDLSSKIKAEQTRAEGKEKEISDKLAIVNGDSNTEGSFRKAIADVVAAAPEDLDTLKEIADKLAGNDDLHTALNQAITEKADASALLNEVTRATGAESGLQAAIATKADATALSNYVLTTALNQQVDTLNAAISAKQDAGNYLVYNTYDEENGYHFNNKFFTLNDGQLAVFDGTELKTTITGVGVQINSISDNQFVTINAEQASFVSDGKGVSYGSNGINSSKYPSCIPTTDGTFKPIDDFALKTDIAHLPTNIVTASAVSDSYFAFEKAIKIYSEAINKIMTIGYTGINFQTNKNDVAINEDGFFISSDSDGTYLCSFTTSGIRFAGKTSTDIPTANGTFINITEQIDNTVNDYNFISQQQADSRYALADTFSSLSAGLSAKQNKITVNSVDVTGIETADITKLRTIVTNLINALSKSGLINETETLE